MVVTIPVLQESVGSGVMARNRIRGNCLVLLNLGTCQHFLREVCDAERLPSWNSENTRITCV